MNMISRVDCRSGTALTPIRLILRTSWDANQAAHREGRAIGGDAAHEMGDEADARMYTAQLAAMSLPPQDIDDCAALLGLANIYFSLIKDGSQGHEHLAAVGSAIDSVCGYFCNHITPKLGPDQLGQNVYSAICNTGERLYVLTTDLLQLPALHPDQAIINAHKKRCERRAFSYSFDDQLGANTLSKSDEARITEADAVAEALRDEIMESRPATIEGVIAKIENLLDTDATAGDRQADIVHMRDGFDALYARREEFDIPWDGQKLLEIIADLRAVAGRPVGAPTEWDFALAAYRAATEAVKGKASDDETDAAVDIASAALRRFVETPSPSGMAMAEKIEIIRAEGIDCEGYAIDALIADARRLGGAA